MEPNPALFAVSVSSSALWRASPASTADLNLCHRGQGAHFDQTRTKHRQPGSWQLKRSLHLEDVDRTANMPSDGYDPSRSQVGDDKLADFLRAPITGDLSEVPGIGKAAVKTMEEAGITTTFQLIGQFLLFKETTEDGELIDAKAHCDKFWFWLKNKGINAYRSGIVLAIAEKVNTMMPGIYDAAEFS